MIQHLLQVDEHQPGRAQICQAPEHQLGQMAHEPSTLTTAAVLLTDLVDARPLGRLVEEPLLLVMLSVLDHVHRHMVEATAGARDPRLLPGELVRQLLEPAVAMDGVPTRTMPLRPAVLLVPQLPVP